MTKTQTKRTYLNCEIANDLFPQKLLDELKVISNHPIVKIHSRESGITSGEPNNCYWISSILSQTFGGKVVFGYCIADFGNKNYKLYGHGCWLNPEGNLVDVTKTIKKVRYFLPVDQKLILNAKTTQVFRDLYFFENKDQIEGAFFESSDKFIQTFERTTNQKVRDLGCLIDQKLLDEKFLNKLVILDAMNSDVIKHLLPEGLNDYQIKYWEYLFRPFIHQVNQESNLIYDLSLGKSMESTFEEFIDIAMKTKQSFFEIAYERKMDLLFPLWGGIDETWSNPRIVYNCVTGISTATGKSIYDYQLHPEVLKIHTIPKDKKLKNEIKTRVAELNKKSFEHISYKEFLVLSNPYLYPHPSLVKKITTKPLAKSPIKRIAFVPKEEN